MNKSFNAIASIPNASDSIIILSIIALPSFVTTDFLVNSCVGEGW